VIDRIEDLLAGFDAEQTPRQARERAEELVRTILSVYGDGLERALSIFHAELGDRAAAVFERLCQDKLVEGLLCLHGLHPIALEDRIEQALESVLPYVHSHKGNIHVSRIEGDIVYVALEGSCDGCPASSATLKLAVERAILQRAPEIREVRAEEVVPGLETSLRILSPV
jgi:Fe-S cluster biogenesis protein NfuA